ncbi:hypothetical protein, partial [Streptomyces sp. NPDC004266]|uniref:hypothetical protein n=1 Tax=Streptomyces sp. NPDC004266 TaxID=3364693 RepID=UPI0036C4AC68
TPPQRPGASSRCTPLLTCHFTPQRQDENGSVTLNTYASIERLGDEPDSLPESEFESRREEVANQVTLLADRAKKAGSDLGGIKSPKGHSDEVGKLLKTMEVGSNTLFQLASNLRATTTPSEVKVLYDQHLEKSYALGDEQRDLFQKLGAKQCIVDTS